MQLHLTVNELEITGRSHIYRDLGIQFARLVDRLWLSDHAGLDFTARILPSDTHMTGFTQSFLSYLRACYGASVPEGRRALTDARIRRIIRWSPGGPGKQ